MRPTARAATTFRGMGDAPWQGDACSLVEAFRAGERSPTEELEAVYAAIDASPLNAFSHLDREHATLGGGRRRRVDAVRWRADRGQGARPGRRLAVHPRLGAAARRHRHRDVDAGAPTARDRRGRPRRADDGIRVRGRQLRPHRAPRHDAQPVAGRPHARRLVGRVGGGRRRRHRHDRHGRRRWRLDPHPGRVLRTRRAEGDVRPGAAVAQLPLRPHHRRHRVPGAVGARRRPVVRRRQRPRPP